MVFSKIQNINIAHFQFLPILCIVMFGLFWVVTWGLTRCSLYFVLVICCYSLAVNKAISQYNWTIWPSHALASDFPHFCITSSLIIWLQSNTTYFQHWNCCSYTDQIIQVSLLCTQHLEFHESRVSYSFAKSNHHETWVHSVMIRLLVKNGWVYWWWHKQLEVSSILQAYVNLKKTISHLMTYHHRIPGPHCTCSQSHRWVVNQYIWSFPSSWCKPDYPCYRYRNSLCIHQYLKHKTYKNVFQSDQGNMEIIKFLLLYILYDNILSLLIIVHS